MGIEYKNICYLLPIARPKNGESFKNWKPFSGNKLSEIINQYNEKCIKYFHECKWRDQDIKENSPVISLYLDGPLKLDTLENECFKQINIILIDLDTFDPKKDDVKDEIEQLKALMDRTRLYHVLQVSNQGNVSPIIMFPYRIVTNQVLRNQSELDEFFNYFCRMNAATVRGYEKAHEKFNTVSTDSKIKPMLDKINVPKIINEIRDVAMLKGLSKTSDKALESLAYNMIINEHAIAKIKEEQTNKSHMVRTAIMDPIRQVDKIPLVSSFKAPEFKSVDMLNVSLNQSPYELAPEQCRIVKDLGFEEKNSFAVFLDEPNIRKTIAGLKGAVNLSKFSANLPDWNK